MVKEHRQSFSTIARDVIMILTFLGSLATMYFDLKERIKVIETKVDLILSGQLRPEAKNGE